MKSIEDLIGEVEDEEAGNENRQEGLVYCSGQWYRKQPSGFWIPVTQQIATQFLKREGFGKGDASDEKSANYELTRIIEERSVAYAGRLAGWKAGIHEAHGIRLLVTSHQPLPESCSSVPFADLMELVSGILGDEQLVRFMCWLRRRREGIRRSVRLEGQALVLFGPAGCGKSWLQSVVTKALGGASANPWRYLSGATTFNGDLIGVEHLCSEDDSPSSEFKVRRSIGNAIKTTLYSAVQSAHAKRQDAVPLEPRWALTISTNDEPENLLVLPPMDESLLDKIMILQCRKPNIHPPSGLTRRDWQERLMREQFPGFLAVVDAMETPHELIDPRSGIQAFQHPDAMEILDGNSPEQALQDLILEHLPGETVWQGTANELETLLRRADPCSIERLAKFPLAVSKFLGRIEKRKPAAVSKLRTAKCNQWRICPCNF